jgi:pimeloyl-ACP methyl ester carboxylesterase
VGRGPGRAVWNDMKEKARNACDTSRACDLLVTALQNLSAMWEGKLELHLVGHSAGSIILGYLLEVLAARGLAASVVTTHLYAPACSVQFANRYYAPQAAVMQRLYMSILADRQERDDEVAIVYRKSLLYLVSDALELDERTPLMGLAKALDPAYTGWDGSSTTMEALSNWRAAAHDVAAKRVTLVDKPQVPTLRDAKGRLQFVDATHGSFDNNIDVVAATLQRITGAAQLPLPVDDLRGF